MDFEFPDTGEGVTEGKFLEWTVEEGEEVEEDQTVAEVETDKAVIDVPAPAQGTITELLASPGDTVKVGEVILKMDTGDQKEGKKNENTDKTSEKADEQNSEIESTEKEVNRTKNSTTEVLALPKVRKMAREKGVDLESIRNEGRVREEDLKEASGKETTADKSEPVKKEAEQLSEVEDGEGEEVSTDYSEVKATPAVRKLAREKKVNLENIEGTGRGGKILRDDVIKAAEGEKTEKKSEGSEEEREVEQIEGEKEVEELSQLRKTVASRMEESRFTAPHVTHVDKADVTELAELRDNAKEKVEVHLTYLPFIMKAAAEALQKYPNLNAEFNSENDEIIRYGNYDMNIAVDTDKGLMIPLIENVDKKSVVDLAAEVGEKAGKARNMELEMSEMKNGTFSITNLGVIGGEEFTPIINYPQVAILGIGRISETAEVFEGEVEPRMTVKLSLSYDHRVVDGAEAARFMNVIVENLENPGELLLNQ